MKNQKINVSYEFKMIIDFELNQESDKLEIYEELRKKFNKFMDSEEWLDCPNYLKEIKD